MFDFSSVATLGFAAAASSIVFTRKDGPWTLFKRVREFVGGTFVCTLCMMTLLVFIGIIFLHGHAVLFLPTGEIHHPLSVLLALPRLLYQAAASAGVGLLVLALTGTLGLDL